MKKSVFMVVALMACIGLSGPALAADGFSKLCKSPRNDGEKKAVETIKGSLGVSKCSEAAKKLASLEKLELVSHGMTSLDVLTGMTGLKNLNLNDNELTDISVLAGFDKLEVLILSNNPIKDFSPIAKLVGLKRLKLDNNLAKQRLKDISFVEELVNLEVFGAEDNAISDITPLAGMVKLRKLELHDNQIKDLSPLAGMVEMESLGLSANKATSLKPLRKMSKLNWANLSNNDFSDLSPLSGHVELGWINFWGNDGIVDVSPLAGLEKLRELGMEDTQLGDERVEKTAANCPSDAKSEAMRKFCVKTNKRRFPDYCRMSKTSDELQRTLAVVKKEMGSADCSVVLDKLRKLTELDLRKHALKDVSPLKNLRLMGSLRVWPEDIAQSVRVNLRHFEEIRIEKLRIMVVEIVEKFLMDGGGQMRVTLEVSLDGKAERINVFSDTDGTIWNGYRIVHKGGWRSDADLEILPTHWGTK